ncbi:Xaa-Pro peptidase family protein [Thalassotalea sp. G2M2-11]|uniref:M24 family metallopeptidase n=1 Tax=Thalassotalea sp. G2M2-11 TaxID=2787627 RepID=UPI0019D0CD57|nr:Xaa-Pro peptidase family protein [Thalassotalea sp. G2M2-11]
MTIGVGGSSAEQELAQLTDMTTDIQAIPLTEFQQRIERAQQIMKEQDIAAIYINAGTNLYYFTGTRWYASERVVGAIIPQSGQVHYIAPTFEVDTLSQYMQIKGKVCSWQEHESPYQLIIDTLQTLGIKNGTLAFDESTEFFVVNGVCELTQNFQITNAKAVTAGCRMHKSAHEIALLQKAKDMTLEVHKATAKILRAGITTKEVEHFIDQAHRKLGAAAGSYFCIVLFGRDSSFPHGVKDPKVLENNDIVLIDTGCQLEGYNSDITRTYVFGEPDQRQREVWNIERQAQQAAFDAAQLGATCGDVDLAARNYIATQGMGPDYQTPGCPHRTGHGVGLDIHEWPYLVKNDQTPLAAGMCFSNEPMLVLPNEFGVRLEDHFYITESGPKWFTEPSYSIDDPFGYQR